MNACDLIPAPLYRTKAPKTKKQKRTKRVSRRAAVEKTPVASPPLEVMDQETHDVAATADELNAGSSTLMMTARGSFPPRQTSLARR